MTKNVNVRLDDGLHGELKAAAEEDHRSLNSEITSLLEAALTARSVAILRVRQREEEQCTS